MILRGICCKNQRKSKKVGRLQKMKFLHTLCKDATLVKINRNDSHIISTPLVAMATADMSNCQFFTVFTIFTTIKMPKYDVIFQNEGEFFQTPSFIQ